MSVGGSPTGGSFPMVVPHSRSTFRVSFAPSITSNSALPYQFSPLRPDESRVSLGLSDSSTRVSSSGSNPFLPVDYFSGPLPGGFHSSPSSSPFLQSGEEENRVQEEERAAALAVALEEGLQGFSQGVHRRGGGEGGVGAAGAFSQGEVQFRAL